jgi:hypothetical protein
LAAVEKQSLHYGNSLAEATVAPAWQAAAEKPEKRRRNQSGGALRGKGG